MRRGKTDLRRRHLPRKGLSALPDREPRRRRHEGGEIDQPSDLLLRGFADLGHGLAEHHAAVAVAERDDAVGLLRGVFQRGPDDVHIGLQTAVRRVLTRAWQLRHCYVEAGVLQEFGERVQMPWLVVGAVDEDDVRAGHDGLDMLTSIGTVTLLISFIGTFVGAARREASPAD